MPMHTAVGRFFTCLAALLLVVMPAVPAFADSSTLQVEPADMIESAPPTIAEREQTGAKTVDSSKEAISQAATRVATPEQALTAKDATIAVADPSASASLTQTADSLTEGMMVVVGAVIIVAASLLLYHFRRE